MGPQIASLITEYKKLGYPSYYVSLRYPASGGADYVSSVNTGANRLAQELNWLSTACGTAMPPVIVAGHSQGAQVILDALGWSSFPHGTSLTAKARRMVRAVVVFGDPTFQRGRPYNAPESATKRDGIFPRNLIVSDRLETDFSFYGWPMGAKGPGTTYKIRSYCVTGDFFCQSDVTDSTFAKHNSYKTVSVVAARNWIDYMLSEGGAPG